MRYMILSGFMLFLAGCMVAPTLQTIAPIRFHDQAPIAFNVAEIRVTQSYKTDFARSDVSPSFPTPPIDAIHHWVDDRLKATGDKGLLEITIEDASVKEHKLTKTKGLKGLFTDDQSERYDGSIKVLFRLYDEKRAASAAQAHVSITRSRSINEDATVETRMQFYNQLTRDMMQAFSKQSELQFETHFTSFMQPPSVKP
jgi:hypothetical protein